MGPRYIVGSRFGRRGHSTVPNRMAFLYVPNGKIMEDWTPETGRG